MGGLSILVGCAQVPNKAQESMGYQESVMAPGEVLIPQAELDINDELTLKLDKNPKAQSEPVRVVDLYFSALGKQCITVQNTQKEKNILCEKRSNVYQVFPNLKN